MGCCTTRVPYIEQAFCPHQWCPAKKVRRRVGAVRTDAPGYQSQWPERVARGGALAQSGTNGASENPGVSVLILYRAARLLTCVTEPAWDPGAHCCQNVRLCRGGGSPLLRSLSVFLCVLRALSWSLVHTGALVGGSVGKNGMSTAETDTSEIELMFLRYTRGVPRPAKNLILVPVLVLIPRQGCRTRCLIVRMPRAECAPHVLQVPTLCGRAWAHHLLTTPTVQLTASYLLRSKGMTI